MSVMTGRPRWTSLALAMAAMVPASVPMTAVEPVMRTVEVDSARHVWVNPRRRARRLLQRQLGISGKRARRMLREEARRG